MANSYEISHVLKGAKLELSTIPTATVFDCTPTIIGGDTHLTMGALDVIGTVKLQPTEEEITVADTYTSPTIMTTGALVVPMVIKAQRLGSKIWCQLSGFSGVAAVTSHVYLPAGSLPLLYRPVNAHFQVVTNQVFEPDGPIPGHLIVDTSGGITYKGWYQDFVMTFTAGEDVFANAVCMKWIV